MFVDYETKIEIPTQVKQYLKRINKLKSFERFLIRNSFDKYQLEVIFALFNVDEIDVDRVMKYITRDMTPNQINLVIVAIMEDLPHEFMNLIYDSSNKVRNEKQLTLLLECYDNGVPLEKTKIVLKEYENGNYIRANILKKLFENDVDDETVEYVQNIDNLTQDNLTSVTYVMDRYRREMIKKDEVRELIRDITLPFEIFNQLVISYSFKLDKHHIDEIRKLIKNNEPYEKIVETRVKYSMEKLSKHINLENLDFSKVKLIRGRVKDGLSMKHVLSLVKN